MGNAIGRNKKKKTAKVMKADGAVTRINLPAAAGTALRGYPGHSLFDAEEVGRAGADARPLSPGQLLRPGKLYFLLELPRPAPPLLRRVRSADEHGTAMGRLERLRLSRSQSASNVPAPTAEGAVRIRVRLPRAQVKKLAEEARDGAEVAERIVALCLADRGVPAAVVASPSPARRERRTRLTPLKEII